MNLGIVALFSNFVSWTIGIILTLIGANERLRRELRDAVGQVADELSRGLELVAIRLHGAKHVTEQEGVAQYLSESREKLLEYHSEFKICKALRDVRARFQSMFDPIKAAMGVGKIEEVDSLLYELEKDERMIFDELGELWLKLQWAAGNLTAPEKRTELVNLLDEELRAVQERQSRIRTLARSVIDTM